MFNGESLLVLAGGLGVDDWAFSRSFNHVLSIDPDEELNAIARYNFNLMDCTNIERLTLTAEEFLQDNNQRFDLVYIDPDRRQDGKRQILLSEHQPDVMALMPHLKKISSRILVKCSPLFDHEMAARETGQLDAIYILSQKGEVKEMLLSIDLNQVAGKDYPIHCIELSHEKQQSETFLESDHSIPPAAGAIEGYFYEAAAGIIKIRKHHHYAFTKGLDLIDKSVPFYCSPQLVNDFMGRHLKIHAAMPFRPKTCMEYLAGLGITKVNLKVRGLKFHTADAYKKLGLKEGGEDYIFIMPFAGKSFMVHGGY